MRRTTGWTSPAPSGRRPRAYSNPSHSARPSPSTSLPHQLSSGVENTRSRYLEYSQEVGGCAYEYHTGTWHINHLKTYTLTSTQPWHDARIPVPEPFMLSPVGNCLSSHHGSKLPSTLSQVPINPLRFHSRFSDNRRPSTNPGTSNECQGEHLTRFNMGIGEQDHNASIDISNGIHSMDVSFVIVN